MWAFIASSFSYMLIVDYKRQESFELSRCDMPDWVSIRCTEDSPRESAALRYALELLEFNLALVL